MIIIKKYPTPIIDGDVKLPTTNPCGFLIP